MAGNFHLPPNAYSSGFDSDDSENAPLISFTQGVRDLPPKRIPKKTKSKALDDEDEGPPKNKRGKMPRFCAEFWLREVSLVASFA